MPASTAEAFIQSACGFIGACCAKAGLGAGTESCHAVYGALAARTSYDVASGEACLGAMREASARPEFCEDASGPPACALVFRSTEARGNQQPGDSCASGRECAPVTDGENRCVNPGGGPAWCQIQIRGKAGDGPCVATIGDPVSVWPDDPPGQRTLRGYLCHESDGLYCDPTERHCLGKKPLGERCLGTEECEATAFCDISAHACLARKAIGAACQPWQVCIPPASCNNATSTCAVAGPAGASCTRGEDCRSATCNGGKCGLALDPGLSLFCGNFPTR